MKKSSEKTNPMARIRDESREDYLEAIYLLSKQYGGFVRSARLAEFMGFSKATIGITGTKGKTTATYMVKSILEHSGYRCGLIGTIEIVIGDESIPAANTTPESFLVQEAFRKMVDAGCDCVVMEVSSQGLMLHRVGGFIFDYGIFTNLEPDHIGPNEHKDLDDYIHCKSLLFQQCRQGIVNADDEHLDKILEGHTCEVETYGFSKDADLVAENVHLSDRGGSLGVVHNCGSVFVVINAALILREKDK